MLLRRDTSIALKTHQVVVKKNLADMYKFEALIPSIGIFDKTLRLHFFFKFYIHVDFQRNVTSIFVK